jgi:hypothetical protein
MVSSSVEITHEHGYAVAVILALWFQQSIIFVIPVALVRKKFGIVPPTLYPRDAQVKSLSLSETQVDEYLRAQRVHQNNVEFLTVFFPIIMISSIFFPMQSAYAGALVWSGRMVTAIGYWKSANKRVWGAWFHFAEYYLVYLAAKTAYQLITLKH